MSNPGYALADAVAPVAAQLGLGLGTQALSTWDLWQGGCAGVDWCKNMAAYPKALRQLQTNKASNPWCQYGANCPDNMGPLPAILDWAGANAANAYVEIYGDDWGIAYDPSNQYHAQYGAEYAAAFQKWGKR